MKKDTVLYEAIKPVGTIQEAWGGSLAVPDLSGTTLGWDSSMGEFVGITLLFLFFMSLIFRKSLPAFFRVFFASLFYRADWVKVEQKFLFRVFRSILLVLLSILLSSSLVSLRLLPYDPFQDNPGGFLLRVGLAVIAYFWLRRLLLWVVGRVTQQQKLFLDATASLYPFFCLMVVWMVLAASLSMGIGWVQGGLVCLYLLYLLTLGKAFIFSKISFFFTFLYLCTLEILVPVLWIGICIK